MERCCNRYCYNNIPVPCPVKMVKYSLRNRYYYCCWYWSEQARTTTIFRYYINSTAELYLHILLNKKYELNSKAIPATNSPWPLMQFVVGTINNTIVDNSV